MEEHLAHDTLTSNAAAPSGELTSRASFVSATVSASSSTSVSIAPAPSSPCFSSICPSAQDWLMSW